MRLSWPWASGLARDFDGFAPDVVHVVTEGPLGSYGRRYALQRDLPLVSSYHTDFPRYAERPHVGVYRCFRALPRGPWSSAWLTLAMKRPKDLGRAPAGL